MATEYIQPQDARYEDRLVAFVDILGWSDMIANPATSAEKLALPATVLDLFVMDSNSEGFSGIKATLMSDTLVASWIHCKDGNTDWTAWYVLKLMGVVKSLWYYDIYTRGAIVFGKLFHDGQMVFGPALLEAYNIEKKVAVYPRIIITSSALRFIEHAHLDNHEPFYKRDDDGQVFLNVFAYVNASDFEAGVQADRERDIGKPDIVKKHDWMLKQLRDSKRSCVKRSGRK
jgi:hypothetical protein